MAHQMKGNESPRPQEWRLISRTKQTTGSTGNDGNATATPSLATSPAATPSPVIPSIQSFDWRFDGVPDDFEVNELTENFNRVLAAAVGAGKLRPNTAAELASERKSTPP